MPVESAADRAALFSADEFGEAAIYTPPGGGAGVPCTAIYNRELVKPFEFEVAGNSGMRAALARRGAMIRVEELPSPAIGGTIAVAGDTLKVSARPRLDETGSIWTLDLTLAS